MSIDRTPEAISARLRRVAELSDLRTEHRLTPKTDYTAAAVDHRLRTVSELRRVCLRLAAARGPGECD